MSTAKASLSIPFIPADSQTSAPRNRPRKQRHNSNHQPKKLEKSPSFNNNLHNGLNNGNNAGAAAGSNSNSNSNSNASNNSGNQQSRGSSNSKSGNNRRETQAVSENDSGSSTATSTTERSRGYLSNRASASRLDQDCNRNNSGRSSGPVGRLFDPKKDPIPVVPSSSSTPSSTAQQPFNRSGPGAPDSRNRQGNNHQRSNADQREQQQRLYDPNQPKAQSSPAPASGKTALLLPTKQSLAATTPSPMDSLVRLTKEIQQLEKKVMEKPGRRTLDSDDDMDSNNRHGGNLTWNRRIDNSKRLASKYLKLLQLDFKSSLKHDIDARCWKLAIYPLIETFRAALRNSEHTSSMSSDSQSLSESDEDHAASIRHYFTDFIGFAQQFYGTLKDTLQKLEAKHATPNSDHIRATISPRWHRCVGIMGDLARYRWLHKLDDDLSKPTDWLIVARRSYREAIDLGPGNGKMYNQLALLSGGRGLESLYYYSKSLTVKSSFMNARETLMSFFAANEQIRSLQNLGLKHSSKTRHQSQNSGTLIDCEGSFLILHAMLFEKINLDNFEKRLRNFSKQLKALHQQKHHVDAGQDSEMSPTRPERWDGFYFMLAVINIAAVYEFNWSGSVIAKSNTAFGSLADHLSTVATLPYSSKLLLSTMEQIMQRYLTSATDAQSKVSPVSLEEQQGWLVYCHAVLVWMASRPFGSGTGMLTNWLMMANHETLPAFWKTLTTFMNHHWSRLTPFEQTDMLSAFSEEMSETVGAESRQEQTQDRTMFMLSPPPLDHEWELRGLAWLPVARFGSQMFKGSQPALDDMELKSDCLWKQGSLKNGHLSKRLVELSLVAALHMEVIEFDFGENAFKINEGYAAQAEEAARVNQHQRHAQNFTSTEEYSTDDNFMSSSHASISHDSGLEEDEATLFSSDGQDYSTSEILELKAKRDQLKSLLNGPDGKGRKSVSLGSLQRDYHPNRNMSSSGSTTGAGGKRTKGGRGYMDRRQHGSNDLHGRSAHRATVADNSTLVIDTNCVVADWTLIQRLVSADRWTVIIPLAVITELDGLKNNPAPLGPAAAAALSYLEESMAMRPKPRRLKIQTSRGNYMNDLSFRVESFNFEKQKQQQQRQHKRSSSNGAGGFGSSGQEEDEYDSDEEIMRNHNVDDFILGLCLWHQENGPFNVPTSPSASPCLGSNRQQRQNVYLVTEPEVSRFWARTIFVG
ncbi:hypothetical protein BG011_007754 [Mortierella polycephala]|uniref:PIN domain-containing protein n=1 Tax=Mortierella polycephala TaxID=41804 RepID=A0A9P6PPG4_9FUNG|nr:hypothetical protein BG011_007754 [Mortierella polycephala]